MHLLKPGKTKGNVGGTQLASSDFYMNPTLRALRDRLQAEAYNSRAKDTLATPPTKDTHANCKLPAEAIIAMRAAYWRYGWTYARCAEYFGVSKSGVNRYITGISGCSVGISEALNGYATVMCPTGDRWPGLDGHKRTGDTPQGERNDLG